MCFCSKNENSKVGEAHIFSGKNYNCMKGDAVDRGNYRGLKLTEQAMKILERIVDGLIRQVVSIDHSQFGFVPGRVTTDAIFVVSGSCRRNT